MQMPFQDTQLNWAFSIAQHRTEILNAFFLFLNLFDTPYFFILLIPMIWLGVSRTWGIRIYYLMLLSAALNSALKSMVGWPRPGHLCSSLGMLTWSGGGFPSGAAQTTMMLAVFLVYYWKGKKRWWIAGSYVTLISFSRLYLGAHFPLDLAGGWLIGGALAAAWIFLQKPIEVFLCAKTPLQRLAIALVLPLVFLYCEGGRALALYGWGVFGIGIGVYVSHRYRLILPDPKTTSEAIKRAVFAALGIVFLLMLGYPLAAPGLSLIAAFWTTVLAALLYRRCFL